MANEPTDNTITEARMEIGLTEPQMLQALNAKRGRYTLFTTPDTNIDRIFLDKAIELVQAYRLWVEAKKAEVVITAARVGTDLDGQRVLSASQVGRILDLSDFNVVKLAQRELLTSKSSHRLNRRVYPVEAVLLFIDKNSTHLHRHNMRSRAPLASSFLKWYEEQRQAAPDATPEPVAV